MRPFFALSFIAALAAGCAPAAGPRPGPWPAANDRVSTRGGTLDATGIGQPDPKAVSQTQRRSTSRDAAILDARTHLLGFLQRIMLPSGVSVGERATEDAAWRGRLEAALSGVEVRKTRWSADDAATVVLSAEKTAVLRALELEP
ncbi:MAG: hypothetical protein HY554_05375 [Elusimicrobia bacterium]|nr:hypothetical protein [Elusimicrobiota bacterium]